MALGDRFILRMKTVASVMAGFPAYNTFAYECTLGNGQAAHLNGVFDAVVPVALKVILSNLCMISEYNTINLDDNTDFAVTAATQTGTSTGDVLPPFAAWSFRYLRRDRTINDGSKRFGLVPEQLWTGTTQAGVALTQIPIINTALAQVIAAGGIEYTPRIWRRQGFYGAGATPFPDTFYPINGVTFVGMGSQNTRKR